MSDIESVVLAAQVIFFALLPVVLFFPARWAVLAWLLMGNLDATGPLSTGDSALGWINATKGVAIPLYLCWRLRRHSSEIVLAPPTKAWIALIAYAAIASLWSPFPLGALKLVGNMVGILLAFVTLEKAAKRGLLSVKTLSILILGTLALGVLQTVVYGSYGYDGLGQPLRFSGFLSPQQYASFLVAFWAIVLWNTQFGPLWRMGLGFAVAVALAYNGSRTWFLGAFLIFMFYLWSSSKEVLMGILFATATTCLLVLLTLNFDPHRSDILANPSSRILATLSALLTGDDTPSSIGLGNLNFRLSIYDGVGDELREASTFQLLFGHGTSSGGVVIARVFPRYYKLDRLDPNRAIHNEWLRAGYEWGVIGLGLLAASIGTILVALLRLKRNHVFRIGALSALSFLPAFALALSTENLIAGAGNAATMGFALLVALIWDTSEAGLRRPAGCQSQYAPCPTH